MYEYMAEFKAVHVMQLPNSASDAASRALWKTEILRLQQVIEARFGTPISEAALREAIVLKIASAGRWPTLSSRAAQSAGAQRRRHPESGVRRHFSFRQNRPD
nr:2-hydroxyglutaryl-CoA dehydratase, D-component [Klebsiella pneumoniae]